MYTDIKSYAHINIKLNYVYMHYSYLTPTGFIFAPPPLDFSTQYLPE